MSRTFQICLHVLVLIHMVCSSNGDSSNKEKVWALKDKSALLKCRKQIPNSLPVMWLHPHTGVAISVNTKVMIPELAKRMSIISNGTRGEYNLLIKYVRYPDDVGAWECISLGMKQTRNLSVIVPPVEQAPTVYPAYITNIHHEAWTFTCSAQYAIPPVNLTWVKVSGPDAKYDVILPNYVVSSQHRVAVSLRLIVSPLNFGSTFKCTADHPSFGGTKENSIAYSPPLSQKVGPNQDMSPDQISKMMKKSQPANAYGIHEKASLLFIIMFICLLALLTCLMFRKRKSWLWNDRSLKSTTSKKRARKCRFYTKAFIWIICSVLLILSLGLSFPVYMKGITIPLLGTDMLMSVSAGSALWMDCGSKILPIKSLLQITWHYNFQPFYRQYMVNDNNIGFPYNSTLGYVLGIRTKSYRIGQISVWPILPGEDGIYSCEVAGLQDNTGRTKIKRKTFGVFVVTGPYLNKPLLALLGVALGSSLLVFIIVSCHMINKQGKKKAPEDETVPAERNGTVTKIFERPLMMGSVT